MTKTFKTIKLKFDSDGYQLNGVLHLPPPPCPPLVVGSHGFLSDSNSPKLSALAQRCNRFNIGFFRFDHRGCGKSEGSFEAGTSVTARRNDILNAIKALQGMGQAKNGMGLFGSSMGGAASLAAAMMQPMDALVTYAAPIRIPTNRIIQNNAQQSIAEKNAMLRYDIAIDASGIHHILVLHGDADTVVPLSHGIEIHELALAPKRLIIQKGGDHPMSNPIHQKAFVREAVDWFQFCLKPIETDMK